MKLGDYVRTKYGITQYKEYETTNGSKLLCMPVIDGSKGIFANIEDIIKSSSNIIDLIEEGDYVNGSRVIEVNKDKETGYVSVEYSILGKDEIMLALLYDEDNIKTIVTKEQFESLEYKVGDKK